MEGEVQAQYCLHGERIEMGAWVIPWSRNSCFSKSRRNTILTPGIDRFMIDEYIASSTIH